MCDTHDRTTIPWIWGYSGCYPSKLQPRRFSAACFKDNSKCWQKLPSFAPPPWRSGASPRSCYWRQAVSLFRPRTTRCPASNHSLFRTWEPGRLRASGRKRPCGSGYGRISVEEGSTTPSGIAFFEFRQDGVLVAEAGVPASEPVREGRIYAEVEGSVNTGLAIANPNSTRWRPSTSI